MASVLGAGPPLVVSRRLDPIAPSGAMPHIAAPPPATPAAAGPTEAPEILEVLARAVAALNASRTGLSLTELRLLLAEPTDAVQRAIVAGLRTKQLRRMGSRSELRYLGNR